MSEKFQKLLNEYPEDAPEKWKKPDLIDNVEDLAIYVDHVIRKVNIELSGHKAQAEMLKIDLEEVANASSEVSRDLTELRQSPNRDDKSKDTLWKKLQYDDVVLTRKLEAAMKDFEVLMGKLKKTEKFATDITAYQKKVMVHLTEVMALAAKQQEEFMALGPEDEVVTPIDLTDEILPPKEKPALTFDLETFKRNLAKFMFEFVRAKVNDQRPNKDQLRQAILEMQENMGTGALLPLEAKQIRDDAFKMAVALNAGYMKGGEKILQKEGLFPDFE